MVTRACISLTILTLIALVGCGERSVEVSWDYNGAVGHALVPPEAIARIGMTTDEFKTKARDIAQFTCEYGPSTAMDESEWAALSFSPDEMFSVCTLLVEYRIERNIHRKIGGP
jgi:hypothetical protein